jgi:hypothetical protein
MDRLSGVPRSTRQNWAKAGLLSEQAAPFSLEAVREVVVLCELRERVGAQAEVAFPQLRPGLATRADGPPPVEAIVDLRTGKSAWVTSDEDIAVAARRGNALRLVDVTDELATAREGYDLIAGTAASSGNGPTDRKRARVPRQRRPAHPSA